MPEAPLPKFSMPKAPKLTEEQQHLEWWAAEATKWVKNLVGEERIIHLQVAAVVIGLALMIWFFINLRRVLANPLAERAGAERATGADRQQKAKKKAEAHAGAQKAKEVAPQDEVRSVTPPHVAEPSRAVVEVVSRTRASSVSHQTSAIKGFPSALVALSPNEKYLVVSCPRQGKLHIYPTQFIRPHLGKDLGSKGYFELESDLGAKPSVAVVGFSDDGAFMALGESNKDTFFVYRVEESGKKAQLHWSMKLPDRRLVSEFETVSVEERGHAVFGFHKKNCEVEVLHNTQGFLGKERFKIGDALAWAHGAGYLAACGSYMFDVRIGKLTIRPDASSFALDRVFTLKAPHRVAALAVTTVGAPSNSAASLVVTVDETGHGAIYSLTDVKASLGEDPLVVGTFDDADYAKNPSASGNLVRGVAYTFTGNPFHEVLHLAIWNATDVAYYRQTDSGTKKVTMKHVRDFHSAHNDDPIDSVCFAHHATALVTSSTNSTVSGVRLWTLTEAAA